jgi:hypothetical protein
VIHLKRFLAVCTLAALLSVNSLAGIIISGGEKTSPSPTPQPSSSETSDEAQTADAESDGDGQDADVTIFVIVFGGQAYVLIW